MRAKALVCSILCALAFSGCILVKVEGRPPAVMPIHRIGELEERERALDRRAEELKKWERELEERERDIEKRSQ
jgi:hypothetical protein